MNRRSFSFPQAALGTVMLLLLLLQGCSSSDQKAAADVTIAESALNQGRLNLAQQYIRRALQQRDDVSDYWLLLAHISLAMNDSAGAFDAYRTVLTLDKGNQEALSALCQIALSSNDADRAEQYADQLALLDPANLLPPTVKAGIAMQHNDRGAAERGLDEVLKKQPGFIPALILRSKLLILQDRYADAARTLEESLKAPGDPDTRLGALKDLYVKTRDRDGYRRTMVRLAAAKPDDPSRQLDYADLLYDEGQRDAADALVRRVASLKPDDIGIASSIVDLWLKHRDALPADAVVGHAAGASREIKAAHAHYADEIGRPDLALKILGPETAAGKPDEGTSDAKVAYAYAIGLRGDKVAAMAQIDAVLAADPSHPRALIARARLGNDVLAAVEDARKVVSDDDSNIIARLTLADLLLRHGEPVLAENTLRAGLASARGDPRIALRLVRLLRAQGRRDSAAAVLTDFARDNPFSLQAAQLR